MFHIRMGVPEMDLYWNDLRSKVHSGKANKGEAKLYRLIGKALYHLSNDPRYPGLNSHEIEALTSRYGTKVWCSYLQNRTPAAGRLYWVYGPGKKDITVIAIEPHPDDKNNSYKKITLSSMGNEL